MAGQGESGSLLAPEHEARFAGLGRLAGAPVCVVGAGGVGSWTIEALARSGGRGIAFSEEVPSAPQLPARACNPGAGPGDVRALNCDAGLGTAAWVTGAFGFALAALAVEEVVGAARLEDVTA